MGERGWETRKGRENGEEERIRNGRKKMGRRD
jgi:hypothetical protein